MVTLGLLNVILNTCACWHGKRLYDENVFTNHGHYPHQQRPINMMPIHVQPAVAMAVPVELARPDFDTVTPTAVPLPVGATVVGGSGGTISATTISVQSQPTAGGGAPVIMGAQFVLPHIGHVYLSSLFLVSSFSFFALSGWLCLRAKRQLRVCVCVCVCVCCCLQRNRILAAWKGLE